MSKHKIDLSESKLSNINEIELFVDELKKDFSDSKASNNQLIAENKRILQMLKNIQHKIDKELEIHKNNMLLTNPHHKAVFNKDQVKVLEEKQSNNAKLITVLQKDHQNILNKKKLFEEGLQQKVADKKHTLEDRISQTKIQIKKLYQDEKESEKKLKAHQNLSQSDYVKEYARIEEELRIYSAKYVKIVTRYNRVTEQLAIAADVSPQFQIPEQIYNKELQVKQQAQYKQYQSIVKLCTILSKRNDSQNNKSNRVYTERLKDLQKTILHLTELERSIAYKQTQILEGKKNMEMIKLRLANHETVDKQLFRVSQGSRVSLGEQLRQKSYSSVKLINYNTKQYNSNNKLRSRGQSFVKLPAKLKE